MKELRIPRPLGLTLSLKSYHRTKDIEELKNIKIRIIELWIMNKMEYNGRVYNMQEMSGMLNMEPAVIMKYLWGFMEKLGKIAQPNKIEAWARGLLCQAVILGSEISSFSAEQVRILMRAQGDTYKPFISQSLNQALANWNSTQTAPLALLRMLTEKQNINIFNAQLNNPEASHQGNNLTTAMALKLINNEITPLPNELPNVANSDTLPDINPRTQDLSIITQPKRFKVPHPGDTGPSNPMPNPTKSDSLIPTNPAEDPIHPTHEERREKKEWIKDVQEEEEDFRM